MATNKVLVKVARLYRAAQADLLGVHALHPGQDVLLWTLGRQPEGMLVSEIAARLGVEQPTVTRSLARLEPGGWFSREAVPSDRRATLIRPTAKGLAAVAAVEEVWRSLAETATAGLDAGQRAMLIGLLGTVRENLLTLAPTGAAVPTPGG